MTVFQLLLYSCVRSFDFDGALMSAECRWDAAGLHVTAEGCGNAGSSRIGGVAHSFYGPRKIERTRCKPIEVTDLKAVR